MLHRREHVVISRGAREPAPELPVAERIAAIEERQRQAARDYVGCIRELDELRRLEQQAQLDRDQVAVHDRLTREVESLGAEESKAAQRARASRASCRARAMG